MSNEVEETIGITLGIFALVACIAAIAFAAVIVVPFILVGAGGIYYWKNVAEPKAKRSALSNRTTELYQEAQAIVPPVETVATALRNSGIEDDKLIGVAAVLYEWEGLEPPDPPPALVDTIAAGRYRDELERYIANTSKTHLRKWQDALTTELSYLQPPPSSGTLFRSSVPRSPAEIDDLIHAFVNEDGLFKRLIDTLNRNYQEEKEVLPRDCKYADYAWRYLRGTPLIDLEYKEQNIGLTDRMRHTYLVGSSGSGKTNLIENIIARDLQDEDCCVVVIDSQTQLIEKLRRLDLPIDDVTVISPEWKLAMNLFDVGYSEMRQQGIEGETLINKTVGLISFAMEGMMGAEFTPPQRTIFQYGVQLVISIPGGNIFTFMEILSNDGHLEYEDQIAEFDPNTQRFFRQDFGSKEYSRSREAIRRRLDTLLLNPTFRRLFSAKENKFNMYNELLSKRLILIDTNKPLLDNEGSSFLGRLFIANIVRAAHMRFNSGQEMRPVYLVVDEAHEYFDQSVSDILEQARKANIGMLVAHQSLSQAKKGSVNIADALMVNTATKIIWTSFRDDAAKFAGNMQVTADTILGLPQYTFGLYTRSQGFCQVRGEANAFGDFPFRDHEGMQLLQDQMEYLYGPHDNNMAEDPADDPDPVREKRGEDLNDDPPRQARPGSSAGQEKTRSKRVDDDLPDIDEI
ncbi:MAG: hypothetical protein ACU0A2_06010 [Cognatishimia sp.]|uniref:hypothetical protein n=1 Tax=Cognatishimia sp. TaxID=2211648 RepID=UPI004057ED97